MVRFLLDTCGARDTWSAEEIHAAHGRILMNATSLELTDTCQGKGAGLYPIYSMMNTSCRNNTRSTVMSDYSVEIRLVLGREKRLPTSTMYLTHQPTSYLRRPIMKEKWFFDCACPRCLDPTENGKWHFAVTNDHFIGKYNLGSYFGSVLCDNMKCGWGCCDIKRSHK